MVEKIRRLNYKVFLYSSILTSLAIGIFGPFLIVFLTEIGGSIESLGFALGLTTLSDAIVSYLAGRFSDRYGRKILLVIAGFMRPLIVVAYTLITSLTELYLLQVMSGAVHAVYFMAESVFLADITEKSTRGKEMGLLDGVTGVIAALATMSGGLLVGKFGFKVVFYIVAVLMFLSTLLRFTYLREELVPRTSRN